MRIIKHSYKLYIRGNDLDAKAAQKLKAGDSLNLVRMADAEDTYEIVITTARGKETDMLSYRESVGIAPFLDEGNLTVKRAEVDRVEIKKGKTRAKDETIVCFTVTYRYEEELKPVLSDDVLAFIPDYDIVLANAIYRCLSEEKTFDKVYLNCYEMDCPVKDRDILRGDEDFENGDFIFNCMVLFNPEFTKCKISAKLYNEDIEYMLRLPPEIQKTALELVNHRRIFEGEDPLCCEIEE